MKFLRFSLFLIIFTLISSNLLIDFASADSQINYQVNTWLANTFVGEVNQDDVTGEFPEQIVNILYKPQGDTIGIRRNHSNNATNFGFHYFFFFAIDYNDYAIITTASAGNTSLFESNTGTAQGHIGYNTSFTHVLNNVFLAGIKDHTNVAHDIGLSESGWSGLGVTSCTGFTTLTGDIFHEFVIQLKNSTAGVSYAYELFIDGNFWCTYLVSTGPTQPAQAILGNADDLGTGTSSGFIRARYRGFQVIDGRHIYSENLAGLSGDSPPGNNPTVIVASAVDSSGAFRSAYSLGETFTLDGLLLNITGAITPISNQLLTFSRLGTTLGQSNTGTTGHGNISIFVTGSVGDLRTYLIDYAGSFSQNLTSATASVIIEIVGIGSTPGNIQTSITISIHDRQGRLRDNIIHGEIIFFQASMKGSDRLNPEFKQVEFFIDKNNTGTLVLCNNCGADTTSLGVAQSQFLAFGTDWIGNSRVQARFAGDATHLASNSSILTFTVISDASQISIVLELDPSTVIAGNRFDALTRLNINPESAPPEPIQRETIRLWWSVGGNWKFLKGGLTNVLGIFEQGFTAPTQLGTFTMKSNSTVNSVNVESTNQTLTVVALINNIPSEQLPDGGGANLDDFFPDIEDINFGFSTDGNGILLWFVAFMMFAFGGIFAMNRTFPEAMSSQVLIGWFVMMFGSWTGIAFGLQWITLNFVILLLAPIALIGGIVMLRIFRGGGTT